MAKYWLLVDGKKRRVAKDKIIVTTHKFVKAGAKRIDLIVEGKE